VPLTSLDRLAELAEVVIVGLRVDLSRTRRGPLRLLPELRARGSRCRARGPVDRSWLRKMIVLVDRFFPSGANCYRRALMEIALDANAAAEPLNLGLQAHGGPRSGHAWLAERRDETTPYDAEFSL
jgi:hypothetical protein